MVRRSDGWMKRWLERWMNVAMVERSDGWGDGWMKQWLERWMDVGMDG